MTQERPTVTFVVRYVNQYREPFYRGLRDALADRGIEFDLVHGHPSPSEALRQDAVTPPWTTLVPNQVIGVRGQELVRQPVWHTIGSSDLVIVEQASRLLLNYELVLRRVLRRHPKIAMIGHGVNLASKPSWAGEQFKRLMTKRVDWFFAYTDGTKRLLEASGFNPDRITVFNNTIDMVGLRAELDSVTKEEIASFRGGLGIDDSPLVLVLGSLYPDKRPDLAVSTGKILASSGADVHFLVVGSGSLGPVMVDEAAANPWLHHIDAAFGRQKAVALASADILFIPGVAGLVILDGFAAGLPIVTGRNRHHPPEIDYVQNGQNGVIVDRPSDERYAAAIHHLLEDRSRAAALGAGATTSGLELSVDAMVADFCEGVVSALERGT